MAAHGAIVITGASTGIGAACAVGLAKRGYTVFAGIRKAADGDRLVAEGGATLKPLIIDVTDQGSIDAARAEVEQALGGAPLACLFNNAGVSVTGPMEFVTMDELRTQFEINVVGQVAVTQAFLPMIRAAKGRIITTGSVGGFMTTPILGPYCMSKYAMESFSDALRVELAPQGIEVVLLQPAAVRTEIWDKGEAAAERWDTDPPDGFMERYGKFFRGVKKFVAERKTKSADPQCVLDAVIHALESPRPKTRYRMGDGVGQRKFLRMLPDRMRDKLLLKAFGVR